jgi:long-chain acyl-CoA synthetase
MQILKPTFFPTVPRLLNKIYSKVKDGMNSAAGLKGWLVKKALATKTNNLKNHNQYTHFFYDKLIFSKIRAITGGNIRCMVTGSAPIAGDVLDFLKICFCCPVHEGYGLTETCGGSVVTLGTDPTSGIVGGPLQNCKIKLKDLPEMGYMSTDDPPRGEICLKGSGVMTGYFMNPEKTKEAFTEDGWFMSGDVGVVLPNGSLKIIDRAKNIFKLSQGEYIAPEKLENVYVKSKWALQVWIYGDSLKDYTVGVIVIDPDTGKAYAKDNG